MPDSIVITGGREFCNGNTIVIALGEGESGSIRVTAEDYEPIFGLPEETVFIVRPDVSSGDTIARVTGDIDIGDKLKF